MKALKLLILCFSVTFLITNCKPDNAAKTEKTGEEVVAVPEGASGLQGSTEAVKSPEDIAKAEIAGMPVTTVEWVDKVHDFGDIEKNSEHSYIFKFKNTGNAPLVIASAKAGCGCTVPTKPEEPILPGKTGEIKVSYNGSGTGQVSKNVDIILNTAAQTEQLTIKTNVLEPTTPK